MQETSNSFLTEQPVGRLMVRYAVPCVISLLVAALYNIVDQIFIGNAVYLGSYGNAANTVVFPLTVVALAVAVLIGDGCCAFVSICLGAGERRTAGQSVGCAVTLSIAAGLVLAAEAAVGAVALLVVELLPVQLIDLFGAANESVYYTQFAVRSFRIYLCMMVFACINKGTFIYLQSLGKALASTALSMVREVVFGVGFALLLPRFSGWTGCCTPCRCRIY